MLLLIFYESGFSPDLGSVVLFRFNTLFRGKKILTPSFGCNFGCKPLPYPLYGVIELLDLLQLNVLVSIKVRVNRGGNAVVRRVSCPKRNNFPSDPDFLRTGDKGVPQIVRVVIVDIIAQMSADSIFIQFFNDFHVDER